MRFADLPCSLQDIAARLLAEKFDTSTTEPVEALARRIGSAFIVLNSLSEPASVQHDSDPSKQ